MQTALLNLLVTLYTARGRDVDRRKEETREESRGGERRASSSIFSRSIHYREKTREIRPRKNNEAAPFITIISYRYE